ncbi:MAG: DNA polymerase III subunit epsilon [Moraxella sp.]|nr:DNA polymerase III subunit epsilon [Moraxella sp.]
MTHITAYTDGACKGNGKVGEGQGGYGAHICYPNGDVHNLWAGENDTTNNRMEILGAILAIKNTPPDVPLTIFTDSGYVKNAMTGWLAGWKKNGWKKSDKKPPENLDLWQTLDTLCQNRQINWQWLKGHAGDVGNETADRLANLGVSGMGDEFIPSKTPPKKTNSTKKQTITMIRRHDHQNPDYDGDTSRLNPDFWAVLPDPVHQGKAERQLIMDTETTGFDYNKGDRIVEVGIVEMVGRKFTGVQLHVYLNPDKEMDEEVIKVHGISNEFLTDKPRFADVAKYLYNFMAGSEIIAHNATFDMNFLKMEFDKVGLTDFKDKVHVTDSLMLARKLYPGQKNTLDALVRRLDVGKKDRTFHGALLDSEILAEVYLAMTSGQIALAIEEDNQEIQETQAVHFMDLSQYATYLIQSAHDKTADDIWRQTMFQA